MNKQTLKSGALLLLAALIWGFAFVCQSESVNLISAYVINFSRSILAFLALLLVSYLFDLKKKKDGVFVESDKKQLITGGVLSGICLFVATTLQQVGIYYTTAGKAGFITSLYIIFVPLIGIFLKKKVGLNIWVSVIIAICGFVMLCFNDLDLKDGINIGEILILICAIFFALQIIVVDKYVDRVDGVKLSCIQFLVVTILSLPIALFFLPNMNDFIKALPSILYLGLLSSAGGYTLQILGQKNMDPTIASLLLSLESVFSVIFGAIFLKDYMVVVEVIGCVLIFISVCLAQINFKEIIGKKK